jgi:hemolysin activation/secretion protein
MHKIRGGWRQGRQIVLGAVIAYVSAAAWAQTAMDVEELRRRSKSEAEERQRQQQAPDVRLPHAAPAVDSEALDLPAETPCFPVREVALEGNVPSPFAWAPGWLERYKGRCIGREGIELILRRLSAKIIAQGYVTTRVGLPEQNLAGGTLRFELIPGRIRAIRFTDPALDGSWRSALPVRSGDLLNLRDIEQGLEQFKRVPSQDANIDIAPGDAPGESDLVITLTRTKPWRLAFTADDSGSAANGRRQGSASLALDNPLQLNDLLSVSLSSDLWNDPHTRGTDGHSVSYSVPWGDWTFQFADSAWYYRQTIQGINQTFLSSGESQSQELRIQRLLRRDRVSKTSLTFRTSVRTQRSAIDHVELQVQRRRTAAAELALQHRQYFGDAQLDVTFAHRRGLGWFGGIDDAPGQVDGSPTWRYRIETLDASLLVPFQVAGQAVRWNSTLHLQQTGDTLYTTDYIAIGNRYTVRGFDGERTLAAERGGYWRNDLETPLGDSGQALYLGLDYGRVAGPGAEYLAGRQLSGAALGLRGAVARNAAIVSYDIFAGWALQKPPGFVTSRPALGFQLSFQY